MRGSSGLGSFHGLIQTTSFIFEAASAGAEFIAADFGVFAADGFRLRLRLCRLCRFVHIVHRWIWGEVDFFDVEPDLGFRRRRGGGFVEDVERGFEANAGWGFRVGEERFESRVGFVGEGLGAFAVKEGAFVLGVSEGVLEGEVIASPVVDGVAMNASFSGGFRGGGAVRQGVNYQELLVGKSVIGHTSHFLTRS